MSKRGKKSSSQKRGKSSGKSSMKKHPDSVETGEKLPFENKIRELESQDPIPGPSGSAKPCKHVQTLKNPPSGVIIKKCEEIEKIAASIQKKCKITHFQEQSAIENSPENVEELEFLVSEIKKLALCVGCDITTPPTEEISGNITDPLVFHNEYYLPYRWPKPKMRVPYIYLHPPFDLQVHVRDIVTRNIHFYFPKPAFYTKILCPTFEDHEKMTNFFIENEMAFHTFSHPSKKKLKVVLRGIPEEVDLEKVTKELCAASIPVLRIHELNTNNDRKNKSKVVLVVLEDNIQGRKLLNIKRMFGQAVVVERPLPKNKQCHRCQKWGHTQRYCRGQTRCVKCAGLHSSKDCMRDPEKEPPRCANCDEDHTASYRRCMFCPDSLKYKHLQNKRKTKDQEHSQVLVTTQNYETLYANIGQV